MTNRALLVSWMMAAAAGGASAPSAHAQVELITLDAGNIESDCPRSRQVGVELGDVLVRNPFVAVVVKAVATAASPDRVGGCVILSSNEQSRGGIAIDPGPSRLWTKADGGIAGEAATIQFLHRSDDFSAVLIYRLEANSPWMDVSTLIRNHDKSRILEAPVIDLVGMDEDGRVGTIEKDGPVYLSDRRGRQTVALASNIARVEIDEIDDGQWVVAMVSEDEQDSFLRRAGGRVRNFGRSVTFRPVAVSKELGGAARDRDNWFRVRPGGEVRIDRRIVSSDAPEQTRELAAIMRQESVNMQRAGEPQAAAPSASKAPSRRLAQKPAIVGNRRENERPGERPPAEPASNGPRAGRPERSSGQPAEPRSLPNLDLPPALEQPRSSSRRASEPTRKAPIAPPAVAAPGLKSTIDELGDLPAPIDE